MLLVNIILFIKKNTLNKLLYSYWVLLFKDPPMSFISRPDIKEQIKVKSVSSHSPTTSTSFPTTGNGSRLCCFFFGGFDIILSLSFSFFIPPFFELEDE